MGVSEVFVGVGTYNRRIASAINRDFDNSAYEQH